MNIAMLVMCLTATNGALSLMHRNNNGNPWQKETNFKILSRYPDNSPMSAIILSTVDENDKTTNLIDKLTADKRLSSFGIVQPGPLKHDDISKSKEMGSPNDAIVPKIVATSESTEQVSTELENTSVAPPTAYNASQWHNIDNDIEIINYNHTKRMSVNYFASCNNQENDELKKSCNIEVSDTTSKLLRDYSYYQKIAESCDTVRCIINKCVHYAHEINNQHSITFCVQQTSAITPEIFSSKLNDAHTALTWIKGMSTTVDIMNDKTEKAMDECARVSKNLNNFISNSTTIGPATAYDDTNIKKLITTANAKLLDTLETHYKQTVDMYEKINTAIEANSNIYKINDSQFNIILSKFEHVLENDTINSKELDRFIRSMKQRHIISKDTISSMVGKLQNLENNLPKLNEIHEVAKKINDMPNKDDDDKLQMDKILQSLSSFEDANKSILSAVNNIRNLNETVMHDQMIDALTNHTDEILKSPAFNDFKQYFDNITKHLQNSNSLSEFVTPDIENINQKINASLSQLNLINTNAKEYLKMADDSIEELKPSKRLRIDANMTKKIDYIYKTLLESKEANSSPFFAQHTLYMFYAVLITAKLLLVSLLVKARRWLSYVFCCGCFRQSRTNSKFYPGVTYKKQEVIDSGI